MWVINKYICTVILIFFSLNTVIAQERIIDWDSLDNYKPIHIQYDTLEGVFLYELVIGSYIEVDVFVKGGKCFVKQSIPFDIQAYKNGYFIFENSYLQTIALVNPSIHYDSAVLESTSRQVYEKEIESLIYIDSSFNPTYGCFYKRYRMKIEVLYLGKVRQRVPVFVANAKEMRKYMRKNNGKYYQLCAIPTYVITNVFEWEEL